MPVRDTHIMAGKTEKQGSTYNASVREWKRSQGFEMIRKGMKRSVISEKLCVNRKTVYNWSVKLEKTGDWHDIKQKGAQSKLNGEQKKRLKEILDSRPRKYGYSTDLWTLKRIADVILKEFGISYNTTHVWSVLRNLGYSAQIPLATAMEKNDNYVKEWLEKEYPEYMKEGREHSATVLFQDESSVQSRPNVRRTWSLRGRRPRMKVREKRSKVSISSAVSVDGNLYSMIKNESMNENDIISLLEQLLLEIPGFLYIFWDSIMIHRSRKVKEFPGNHNDRLITRRIPAYSPELNPDEFVWNMLKYQELPNFCPDSKEDLESTVVAAMVKLKNDPAGVRKTIRGSRLPLPA